MAWLSLPEAPPPHPSGDVQAFIPPCRHMVSQGARQTQGNISLQEKNNKTSEEQRHYKDDKLKSQHLRKQN